MDKLNEIKKGFNTSYIDSSFNSNLAYRHEFVSNDSKKGKKVLSVIETELSKCDEFFISVAFITMSGITPLLQTLKELEVRGIKGKILTTDYLTFSEPKALLKLAELKNLEVRMYCSNDETGGFHTKGYIFHEDEIYKIIIGSSNMTLNAITRNKEWNTKIVSTESGEMAKEIVGEFKELWEADNTRTFEEFYDEYKLAYLKKMLVEKQKKVAREDQVVSLDRYKLKPNKMQVAFIENLMKMRGEGIDRAVLISATGTGKTYASAFAMRELGYKKVLFLVHRNQIANQALKSFRKVFGNSVSMGLLTGKYSDYDKDFIFATVQTLSKEENLRRLGQYRFEACIYDEAHHTSAGSYKKVMDYFKPKFTLGMTATPDRRDDNLEGRNIYEIFDYNIAYEIRLQQAMEEDLLCPFHYFGITDLELVSDDNTIDEASEIMKGRGDLENTKYFRYLTSDERVKHVIDKANYFGYSGDRVKGLMFCSRVEEARALSEKFNKYGYRTKVLSGQDKEEDRTKAIERLVANESEEERKESIERIRRNESVRDYENLDYILSVDIFSEGVDVPEINQVIMLRPTKSPIVFIQQLGRGLRKSENKEYVVVLDFIGNYNNNFMIPIALSGDRTYNKDNVRRYITEGGRIIPGSSTIHFDEISKKRIFASVDNANFSDIKLIKENYVRLKDKLGRIPKLADFDKYGEMDVLRIFDNKSLGSYYKFLVKYEKEYKVRLSAVEEKIIEFISVKLANGKRVDELVLLKKLIEAPEENMQLGKLADTLKADYSVTLNRDKLDGIINLMTNEFATGSGKKTYETCVFIEKSRIVDRTNIYKSYIHRFFDIRDEYKVSESFKRLLRNYEFKAIVNELIEFGISRNKRDFSKRYQDTDLVLYQKYTYEDVCRMLGWEHNEVPLNIGGYKYDKKTKTFPVFINYDKASDVVDTQNYADHFTSSSSLIAISKSGRSRGSEDVQNFLNARKKGIDVTLFVRKNKDDKISKEFYFLGRMTATGNTEEFIMPNTDKTAVEIEWILDTPVREDIYEYIVSG